METKRFSQTAVEDFYLAQDLNCAEALLAAASERYQLGLNEAALRCAAGFGGGMGIGSVCGALTGSVMAMSNLFVREKAHEGPLMKEVNRRFFELCLQRWGSIHCEVLKERYFDDEHQCSRVVEFCAELLEDVVEEFSSSRVR